MPKKLKSYRNWLGDKLSDPKRAARYLNAAAEDSEAMFLKALRKVALSQTRPMSEIAESCGVSRESLYRMLSETGNPTSDNRRAILASLGFKSVVVPLAADDSGQVTKSINSASVEDSSTTSVLAVNDAATKRASASQSFYLHAYLPLGTPGNTNLGITATNYAVPPLGSVPFAVGTLSAPFSDYLYRTADTPTMPEGTALYTINPADSNIAPRPIARLQYV